MTEVVNIALCGMPAAEARMIELVLQANSDENLSFRLVTELTHQAHFALVDVESPQGLPQFTRWRSRWPQIIPISISDTGLGGPGPLRMVHRQVLRDLPHVMLRAVNQWMNGARILPEVAKVTAPTASAPNQQAAAETPAKKPFLRRTGEQAAVHPMAADVQQASQLLALIVHPDANRRREISLLLVAQGYKCWQTDSRAGASAAASEKQFDLVVMAAELPDGDGFGLCHDWKSKRSFHKVPVLILAKSESAFSKARASYARCDQLLIEPVCDTRWQAVIETYASGEHRLSAQAPAVDGQLNKIINPQKV